VTAADAMTPGPLTITPRTSVAAALRLARDNGIAHLPVVERGTIVGVVRARSGCWP
jgi:acetoin utilization protein AcuB